MVVDRKKLVKMAVLVMAFIISVALFAAVYAWYKKREKKALEKAVKDLEPKWMGKKDVFGIGIILGKYIEILVGTEQVKAEIESTLTKGRWEGAEVKVVVGKQPEALDKEKPELPKSSHTPKPEEKDEKK
jgi:outer membrane biosynthesis protein TonB